MYSQVPLLRNFFQLHLIRTSKILSNTNSRSFHIFPGRSRNILEIQRLQSHSQHPTTSPGDKAKDPKLYLNVKAPNHLQLIARFLVEGDRSFLSNVWLASTMALRRFFGGAIVEQKIHRSFTPLD